MMNIRRLFLEKGPMKGPKIQIIVDINTYLLLNIFFQRNLQLNLSPAFSSLNDYWYRYHSSDTGYWHNLEIKEERSKTLNEGCNKSSFKRPSPGGPFWGNMTTFHHGTTKCWFLRIDMLNKEKSLQTDATMKAN